MLIVLLMGGKLEALGMEHTAVPQAVVGVLVIIPHVILLMVVVLISSEIQGLL
jgi:hypothetical protein